MFRSGHEPGARIVGYARLRPLLKRGDESVLGEVLGEADIADDAGQAGDEPGGFDPPDCIDCAMGIGSRHGYRSHHVSIGPCKRGDRFPPFRKRGERMGVDCLCSRGDLTPLPSKIIHHRERRTRSFGFLRSLLGDLRAFVVDLHACGWSPTVCKESPPARTSGELRSRPPSRASISYEVP